MDSDGNVTAKEAYEQAVALLRRGHVEHAAEILRRILAVAPDHVESLHYSGVAEHQLGRTQEGIRRIERALELAPDYADAHNNLGNILKRRGELARAQTEYERALELSPGNPDTLNNLGTLRGAAGDHRGAIWLYEQVFAIDPAHVEAHHNIGNALLAVNENDAALAAFRRAMELHPYDGVSYRRLAAAFYATGHHADAAAVYARWLALEPENPEARHFVAATNGEGAPSRASNEYVKLTFDRFATSFDAVLQRLEYRAPEIVGAVVERTLGVPRAELDVLDAGCGTGLGGPKLRPYARRLVGLDLSERMIAAARERGVYDDFVVGDLETYFAAHEADCDLVVAIDTLCYFGDLASVLVGFGRTLRPGGHAVFTLEGAPEDAAPAGFVLHGHGRYSHRETYVRECLGRAGFASMSLESAELRKEAGKPVKGLVVLAATARR